MSDIYQPYRDMLAGLDVPIHADVPYPGRYKMKRGGAFVPVAIGPDADIALVDGQPTDPVAVWTYCAKYPVTQDAYKFRIANGHWPDEPRPAPLSNRPADPFAALLADIEDKTKQADQLLKREITTQTDCDLARNIQAGLLALKKSADAMHKDEKARPLEQCRAIDTKFGFRDDIADLAARVRSKFEAWMRAEERRQREEADRKFREEQARVEAERKRLEAERAQQMEDDPIAALTSPPPEMPEAPTAPEPVKVQAGGGVGRKAGLKSVWVPVMTDYKAALAHFADNAKVRELVQKLGEQAVKGGARDVPGFEVKEERRAA